MANGQGIAVDKVKPKGPETAGAVNFLELFNGHDKMTPLPYRPSSVNGPDAYFPPLVPPPPREPGGMPLMALATCT